MRQVTSMTMLLHLVILVWSFISSNSSISEISAWLEDCLHKMRGRRSTHILLYDGWSGHSGVQWSVFDKALDVQIASCFITQFL